VRDLAAAEAEIERQAAVIREQAARIEHWRKRVEAPDETRLLAIGVLTKERDSVREHRDSLLASLTAVRAHRDAMLEEVAASARQAAADLADARAESAALVLAGDAMAELLEQVGDARKDAPYLKAWAEAKGLRSRKPA
jgi:small-conductance mechanosensitive channel